VTAQEAFNVMVKQQIAPALRELGFKGSGQRFTLPNEEHYALVGLQKFSWSDCDEVEFTANVTVAERGVWEAERRQGRNLPKQPSASIFYGTFVWQRRIGSLAPGGEERKWRVSPDRPTDAVAEDFVATIRDHGLPAMRKQMRAR
jgi:hypothetical protein